MISVFCEHITPRLRYVLDFCFAQKGFDYELVTSRDEWKSKRDLRINYSVYPLPAELQITPEGLLSEDGIRKQIDIQLSPEECSVSGITDSLSVIFWMLTRYEEYSDHERDEHDRYPGKQSLLVKSGLNNKPLADILVKKIWEDIGLDYQVIQNGFECVPSFDIDVAWAYKHRSLYRTLGAGFTKGNLLQRIKVIAGVQKDPYDTYSYITEIASRVNRIICFVLLADWSKYNKNINWKNEQYRSLIRGLNSVGGMGIHPSYESSKNENILEKEIFRLEQIVGHEIVKSRQHFLRFRIPDTYEMLLSQGIQREFSMGFADETGFRAGTSFPFRFFNLRTNSETSLLIFPFAYMDGVLKDKLRLNPSQAQAHVESLVNEVKAVGGVFMCIWHNSSINDFGEWSGWRSVLDHNLSLVERNEQSSFDDFWI